MAPKFRKPAVFALCLLPLAWLAYLVALYAIGDPLALGADPGKEIVLFLGKWGLIFMLATLSATPLQEIFKWRLVIYRRMLGLFAFFYAALHLSAYLVFLLGLDFPGFWADLVERPYITAGAGAILLMLPLALTSTAKMQRRLGSRWKVLHRLVYPASFLIIIHFFWQTRSDFTESLLYSALLAWLLGYRAFKSRRVQGSIKSL